MLAIGALLIAGPRLGAPDHHHGVMLGAAAGVLFGVSDVAIKALTGARRPRSASSLSPWLAVTDPRLGRRLLRLGPRPAGRRGRPGHRRHLHRRQRLLHPRRHHRLRRPDARRHASASPSRPSPSCSSSSPRSSRRRRSAPPPRTPQRLAPSPSRSRSAAAGASWRECTSSLRMMLLTCVRTVSAEITSVSAISTVVRSGPSRPTTSHSRAVSGPLIGRSCRPLAEVARPGAASAGARRPPRPPPRRRARAAARRARGPSSR